ncbi:TatD family hydrolase [Paenibacillus sp.]|uniref:TatD family hydrolase n=1 Tax=Paenibacillus sp. TaxID=58172 RepID=UPI002D5DBA8B|nr:TatD family hydrolase [Paenibacillus sp.]HZG55818.1 TatD family hydrolase [Paenibacillus sp.]
MFITDTHTHLDHKSFDGERDDIVRRAREAGVERIINIGCNRESIPTTLALADAYDCVEAVVGWHPQDAIDFRAEDLDYIEELARTHPKVVAIGEMGLDYYWDTSPKDVQHRVFREQIRLARKLGMPIVIHNRDAHADVVAILREEKAYDVGGVMHCFSGSWETARLCLDMNFYLSFGGPITFKNAKQPKEVLANAPIDRVLVETDAPYLTPHPYRGKRNETGYVRLVAEAAAEIKGMSLEDFAAQTSANAAALFRSKQESRR